MDLKIKLKPNLKVEPLPTGAVRVTRDGEALVYPADSPIAKATWGCLGFRGPATMENTDESTCTRKITRVDLVTRTVVIE